MWQDTRRAGKDRRRENMWTKVLAEPASHSKLGRDPEENWLEAQSGDGVGVHSVCVSGCGTDGQ